MDVVLFFNFARALHTDSLHHLYLHSALFNHTPLTAALVSGVYALSGDSILRFAFLLRCISILADVVLVVALVRWRHRLGMPPWWVLGLFAASPVSLMISGFHGNIDPLMTLLLFLAACACVFGQPLWCGVLFALASNIKVVPLILAPVFFFFWLGRKQAAKFTIAAASLLLAGAALPLWRYPLVYLHNVYGYNSNWGVWGIPYWLRQTGWRTLQTISLHDFTFSQLLIAQVLKVVAVAGICALAWVRRRCGSKEIFHTLAWSWIFLFVFLPGLGPQYAVWLAPFVLLLSASWYAFLTIASSIFLFAFYQSTASGGFPWFFALPLDKHTSFWSAWGNVFWVALIVVLVNQTPTVWRGGAYQRKRLSTVTHLA